MKIPHHSRYAYSAINNRPDYDWPGGKRLAVYVSIAIEHFAFGTGLGHMISAEIPQPDQRAFAWRDYGNRVAVWRILDLLDEFAIPASHMLNTIMFDYAPEVAQAIMARGDEIIGHGRTNAERQGQLWEEDEARLLREVRDSIEQHTGTAPKGWIGPWLSESTLTPDLLQEAGYKYTMDWPLDDQPVWMKTRGGRLMAMPYSQDLNDSTQIIFHHHTPDAFAQMQVDRFDALLNLSERQPLVCAIPLHPMISGQPHRLAATRRVLSRIVEQADRGRVWLARPGEIYDHCAEMAPGVVPS